MDNRDQLIKALSGAFATENEEAKEGKLYRYEQMMINNQRCSRLLDIKPTDIEARNMSPEMMTINALARFLKEVNTEDSRKTGRLLEALCKKADEDEKMFFDIYEVAKDVTERLRSFTPDSPQRMLMVLHAQNSLNKLA